MAIEHENEINEWLKTFEKLPEERQEQLKLWFSTQKIIIDNSDLTPEDWFQYIEWALDNPFDYSFIEDFPDVEAAGASDTTQKDDTTRGARELVGAETKKNAPQDGEGIQKKAKKEGIERELFDQFMKNHLGSGRR